MNDYVKLQPAFFGKDSAEEAAYLLGSACHQQAQSQVPVCIVTDLKGNILLRNMEPQSEQAKKWVITMARTTVTRFWTASTAYVQLSIEATDLSNRLPVVSVPPSRPGANANAIGSPSAVLPLYLMDEVCIYMGYIDTMRAVVQDDITQNRLLRVFIGSIDTITAAGNANMGNSVVIQMRDRMKYLMDTLGSYNTSDFSRQNLAVATGQNKDSTLPDGSITRKYIILGLAQRAVGNLQGSKSLNDDRIDPATRSLCDSVCGLRINSAYSLDTSSAAVDASSLFGPYERTGATDSRDYIYKGDGQSPFIGGSVVNFPLPNVASSPSSNAYSFNINFNIITGRAPYNNSTITALQSGFQVTDRVPVEYIKYLALQEPWVGEMFADHRSGDMWYAPRGLDLTGLEDKKRFFRTYFYRMYPQNLEYVPGETYSKPHLAQMARSFREETSILGWRSNIIATNADKIGENSKSIVHLKVTPKWLEGREHACTFFYLTEPVTTGNIQELAIIALMFARHQGKETRTASVTLLGDPSITPGEAMQVIGSPLIVPGVYPDPFEDVNGKQQWQVDRTNVKEYYQGTKDLYTEFAKNIKDKSGATDTANASTLTVANGQMINAATDPAAATVPKAVEVALLPTEAAAVDMCFSRFVKATEGSANPNGNNVQFPTDPKTVWRAEGVIHKFNDGEPGYYTEVSLMSTT
jgi:hypothetical protein